MADEIKNELPISGRKVMARKSNKDEFELIPSDWIRHHLSQYDEWFCPTEPSNLFKIKK